MARLRQPNVWRCAGARIAPLIAELEAWMRAGTRPKLSRHAESAKAIDYMLKRWPAFTRFLDDGRICLIEQCRGASAARYCPGQKIMAVRGFRSRRTAGRGDLQPDRHRQIERCRSAGLAG